MSYEKMFSDITICKNEILETRKAFGRKITMASYEGLTKGLMLMFVYCPDEFQPMVEAHLMEARMRAMSGFWIEN